MDLAAKRLAIIEEHRKLEKQRGSGWHPADPGAERREREQEMDLSARPIAFIDDDLIHVVGPCAERVVTALRAWLDREGPKIGPFHPPEQKHAKKKVERTLQAVAREGDGICVPQQDWNGCLYALAAQNVQVVTTSAHDE